VVEESKERRKERGRFPFLILPNFEASPEQLWRPYPILFPSAVIPDILYRESISVSLRMDTRHKLRI
jgi:hypothetical protein